MILQLFYYILFKPVSKIKTMIYTDHVSLPTLYIEYKVLFYKTYIWISITYKKNSRYLKKKKVVDYNFYNVRNYCWFEFEIQFSNIVYLSPLAFKQ